MLAAIKQLYKSPTPCRSISLTTSKSVPANKNTATTITALEVDNNARRATNVAYTVIVPKNLHIAVNKKSIINGL